MIFGYHVSIAGGLHKAFIHAKALTCEAIQIFISSPQMWKTSDVTNIAIEEYKKAKKESKIKKILVHSSYLPNPSSPKASLRNMSLKKMKDEIKIVYKIGADGYNFHCGSNSNSNKEGVKLAIKTLNRLAELTNEQWPVKLIIESDAGAGNKIGDTIEELSDIWKRLKNKKRFGFCLDTCHLFVSGTDLRTKQNVSDLVKKFDKLINLKHLEFIHINDAKFGLNSKKDRHANIGKGEIGLKGFGYLINHPKLKNIPFILETPQTGNIKKDLEDIKILRKLVK